MLTSVHCFLNISRKEKNQMGFWLILKARRKGYKTRYFLIFSEVNFGKTTDLNSAETSFFCIFDRYLTDFNQQNKSWVKINNLFEISTKNWVDSYVFQSFSSTFFFLEKFAWGPPQGSVKKMNLIRKPFEQWETSSELVKL